SHKLPDANEGHLTNKDLYNDKELIDEADLNWYDYGFRYYDPQIGRFPQLDPLTDDYPYYTPYQFAGCEPIANVDVDGLEPASVTRFANSVSGTSKALRNGGYAVIWEAGGVVNAKIFSSASIAASKDLIRVAQLALISARGAADALYNASTIGLYDAFGGNHLKEYKTAAEQKAYLEGRLAGDAAAVAAGVIEIEAGGATAALAGVTGVGAIAGGAVALHGAVSAAVATADATWALQKLYQLNMASTASSDPVSSQNQQSSNSPTTNTPKKERGTWKLTKEGSSEIKNHKTFGTFYKSKSDGLWWSVDKAGHGGSKFKVFRETKEGLEWYKDADKYGDFIENKHKGPTGKFIPWKFLTTVK
ncbi:MAG: RHS repeat-associated core domain-containing protein, partial [Chitinophagaceae bacterium]|nr:RHS repeat-associated core domain-containing protein [Chitinophagaceae bacterium]